MALQGVSSFESFCSLSPSDLFLLPPNSTLEAASIDTVGQEEYNLNIVINLLAYRLKSVQQKESNIHEKYKSSQNITEQSKHLGGRNLSYLLRISLSFHQLPPHLQIKTKSPQSMDRI